MLAMSLGWFLLTRLNVWMVFLAEWRIWWLIWWDSAFAEEFGESTSGFPRNVHPRGPSRSILQYATWSKAHACYQKMPNDAKKMFFFVSHGKKHGSIDCLLYHSQCCKVNWQKSCGQLLLWRGNAVAAFLAWARQERNASLRNGQIQWANKRIHASVSLQVCASTFNHQMKYAVGIPWLVRYQVQSACLPQTSWDPGEVPQRAPVSYTFEGLWDLKDFFTIAMKHAWWVGVVLGKSGKAQSVGLHLCFQGSRQTASCRQIHFLKYSQSMRPGPWVGNCANWGSERRTKQWSVTLLASVLD